MKDSRVPSVSGMCSNLPNVKVSGYRWIACEMREDLLQTLNQVTTASPSLYCSGGEGSPKPRIGSLHVGVWALFKLRKSRCMPLSLVVGKSAY